VVCVCVGVCVWVCGYVCVCVVWVCVGVCVCVRARARAFYGEVSALSVAFQTRINY